MEMDLSFQSHDQDTYEEYIVGSAEVVGLMCLYVFVNGDQATYQKLKPAAERLGAAFQKVNFLRDIKYDIEHLHRSYFPELAGNELTPKNKRAIEEDIRKDFDLALEGIKQLPNNCRFGVYLAYKYYRTLFNKIRELPPEQIMESRVRINNGRKFGIMVRSYLAINFQPVWSL